MAAAGEKYWKYVHYSVILPMASCYLQHMHKTPDHENSGYSKKHRWVFKLNWQATVIHVHISLSAKLKNIFFVKYCNDSFNKTYHLFQMVGQARVGSVYG